MNRIRIVVTTAVFLGISRVSVFL